MQHTLLIYRLKTIKSLHQPSRIMLSNEINKFLANEKHFMGCYPCDSLPPFPKQFPRSLIVNTDSVQRPGDHWVGLVFTEEKCFYFDSFGVGILEVDIWRYVNNRYETFIHSVAEIQSIESEKCGEFCIGFVLHVKSIKSYEKYIKKFHLKNTMLNDFEIEQCLRGYLRKYKT